MVVKRDIGIFLGYGPGTIKNHEGIIRLLISLLHSKEFRNRVVIALPSWSRKELSEVLRSVKEIDVKELEFLFCRKRKRLFFFLHQLVSKFSKKRGKSKGTLRSIIKHIEETIIYLSARSLFLFFLLALPLVLLSFMVKAVNLAIYVAKKLFISKISPRLKLWLAEQKKKIKHFLYRIYNDIKSQEFARIVKKINRRPEIAVWYIPTAFWPEIKKIKTRKVIAVPDVVFEEFPFVFSAHHHQFEPSYHRIHETMKVNAHFLCYSQHVRTEHLSKPFQIGEENISVIRHGCTNLAGFLQRQGQSQTEAAIQILQTFQKTVLAEDPYLADFHLPAMKFIFYSSQIRPHKNILNLVKAFEILLRKRFVNVKLVITGNLFADEAIKSYIDQQNLQNDVISFHGVSNEVLAALNHLAICSVNPTLFEGGFPFTFSEAYSVGTPSMMSRIPAVLEESQDSTLNSLMLFDPYQIEEMAARIEWGIHHREELIRLQKPLYEKFAARSWASCVQEYLDLFDKVGREVPAR